MVDLSALISLLTDLGLGVTARTVFTVDWSFFREYGASGCDGSRNEVSAEKHRKRERKISNPSQPGGGSV